MSDIPKEEYVIDKNGKYWEEIFDELQVIFDSVDERDPDKALSLIIKFTGEALDDG